MKSGLLIVNAFLNATKYTEIYNLLYEAASFTGMKLNVMSNGEFLNRSDNGTLCPDISIYDYVVYWDKDIPLAKALEAQGLRLFNSADAIMLCDNKALTFEALAGKIRLPKTYRIPQTFAAIGYTSTTFLDLIEAELGFPYIIKECYGSFGAQVYLIHTRQEALDALKSACGRECIAQEYIRESSGHDIRIHTVGDRIVTAMKRSNPNDFRANITNGGSMEPYTPSHEEAQMALQVASLLGLDFAGVDILFGSDGPVLCEVNSNAHFKNIYNCTGVNVATEIMKHIADSL